MSRPTILIVDDVPTIRAILNRVLTTRGYHVIAAASGQEALRLARQYSPALILLDLGLPGLDGWEVARCVRADPALEEIPIIAMTGYGVFSAIRAAQDAGCQRVLRKPLDLDELEQQVVIFVTSM